MLLEFHPESVEELEAGNAITGASVCNDPGRSDPKREAPAETGAHDSRYVPFAISVEVYGRFRGDSCTLSLRRPAPAASRAFESSGTTCNDTAEVDEEDPVHGIVTVITTLSGGDGENRAVVVRQDKRRAERGPRQRSASFGKRASFLDDRLR